MTNLQKMFGIAPIPGLLDPDYVVGVARYKNVVHWLLSDRDNFVLDLKKWRDEFVSAGYQVPELAVVAAQRSGIVVVDQSTAEEFLTSPEVHKLTLQFLRQNLLERFPSAKSWWDVGFLFPIAFIDFDNKRFAGFYESGPRLERYVPDGWVGEFADFANTFSEEVFPTADKFWIVDGRDLLQELNERGSALEEGRGKTDDRIEPP
jgi:hypothetical protein